MTKRIPLTIHIRHHEFGIVAYLRDGIFVVGRTMAYDTESEAREAAERIAYQMHREVQS